MRDQAEEPSETKQQQEQNKVLCKMYFDCNTKKTKLVTLLNKQQILNICDSVVACR